MHNESLEIDNRNILLGDILKEKITKNSKIKVAAATFSIFAFKELKDSLQNIDELQFIFTSPTFTNGEIKEQLREYTIPKRLREDSLFGSKYELKLRNELTHKALAKECSEWIKRKAKFKSINLTEESIDDGIRIETDNSIISVDKLKNFDLKELGYETSIFKSTRNLYYAPQSLSYLKEFEDYWNNDEYFRDVTTELLENLNIAFKENSPEFLYYVTIYNIFKDFLEDIDDDQLPITGVKYKESKIWNLLYDFQKDAVEAIIGKLEKFNGCILADSVGLGKTFTALATMTYYAYRGKRILVLCPKKLENNWNMYRHDYINNPIYDRHLQYDVLFHTDLSRDKGISNGIDLELNRFDTYDLVVIDESHNFRNGSSSTKEIEEGKENRYTKLMNNIIRPGVKTKVLMLSATPVNNRFNDLKNQLALAYEGESKQIDEKLNLSSSIDDIFRQAQTSYNNWVKLSVEERTIDKLLNKLDLDFFKILDNVTIARSRKHIREFYDQSDIGDFPKRLSPKNFSPELTHSELNVTYEKIYNLLDQLNLTIYVPSLFLHPSKTYKYEKKYEGQAKYLTQSGREYGIKKLMMINLLKRLESSIEAFRYTLIGVVKETIVDTVEKINSYEKTGRNLSIVERELNDEDLDVEDSNLDFVIGQKVPIELEDMDYITWKRELQSDLIVINNIEKMVEKITPENDLKLQTLKNLIDDKMIKPINEGNKKLLIFSAYATTVDYLYENISTYVLEKYNINTAKITGTDGFKTTLKTKNKDLNSILTYFSPVSKQKNKLLPNDNKEIDIIIATDVISEGQNLQDADMMINFDIHWNPVRIIQRFGRIDRIGSINQYIQLVNFWPNIKLDEYINLKSRVESRMKISVLTSTADENILTNDELEDLNYRKKQLQRLKMEVVDLEEMTDGISIMDLGLEEYRLDLKRYIKENPNVEKVPKGLQTIIPVNNSSDEGVIFVLKDKKFKDKPKLNDRLFPYSIVYVNKSGELEQLNNNSKRNLEKLRLLTKGMNKPFFDHIEQFNKETNDGSEMSKYSVLLQKAIEKNNYSEQQNTISSLFSMESVDLMSQNTNESDDYELVSFFILMKRGE